MALTDEVDVRGLVLPTEVYLGVLNKRPIGETAGDTTLERRRSDAMVARGVPDD